MTTQTTAKLDKIAKAYTNIERRENLLVVSVENKEFAICESHGELSVYPTFADGINHDGSTRWEFIGVGKTGKTARTVANFIASRI